MYGSTPPPGTSPPYWTGSCNYWRFLFNSSFVTVHSSASFTPSVFLFSSCSASSASKIIPELAQMYSGPRGFSWNFSSRKRARLAKRWQLAIAASQLAVSLAKKNFKKNLWDQGSTNEPACRLGGLWRLRDFLYSHFSDTLIFFHGMQFLLSSTCKYVVFPGPFQTTLWYPRELFLSNVLLLNCGGGIGTMRDISVETLP